MINHNETLVRDSAKGKGLRVKTHVRAGKLAANHNETLVSDRPRKRLAQLRRLPSYGVVAGEIAYGPLNG